MHMQYFTYDNGIMVPEAFLLPEQRQRYQNNRLGKLHEPVEEAIFTRSIADLPPQSLFLNIGAAWGYYAILARRLRPDLQICAVESHPRMCTMMFRAVEINQAPGIMLVNRAVVRATNASESMHQDFAYGAHVKQDASEHTTTVAPIGIGDLLTLFQHIPHIMISMDVQGEETYLLDELQQMTPDFTANIDTLLIGTHGDSRHEVCRDCLIGMGYQLLHDDPAPAEQPDGILCAHRAKSNSQEPESATD